MSLSTEQIAQLRLRYRNDAEAFVSDCLWIANKNKDLVRLTPSYLQQRSISVVNQLDRLGVPARVVNLKSRQTRKSTIWTALAFWKHYFATGPRQTTIMGSIYKETDSLMRMTYRYAQKLPQHMQRELKSTVTLELVDTGAYYSIQTANNLRADQGTTGSTMIGTEVPYWQHGADTGLAIMNSMPKLPGTLAAWEGTANGQDDLFYPTWIEAEAHVRELCAHFGAIDQYDLLFNLTGWGDDKYPNGFWDGTWFPIFDAWFDEPEYRMRPDLMGVFDGKLTTDEQILKEVYGCDNAQLAFRRYTIKTDCGGDIDKFNQEYPDTPTNAFRFSGKPYFNVYIINEWAPKSNRFQQQLRRCRMEWETEPRFDPRTGETTNKEDLRVRMFEAQNGEVLVYRHPEHMEFEDAYVIGSDIARGLNFGTGDFSAALVKSQITLQYVAFMRGRYSEARWGELLAMLAIYYQRAGLLIETNTGPAPQNAAEKYYDNFIYGVRHVRGEVIRDDKPGWYTTEQSKRLGCKDLKSFIETYPRSMPFHQFWVEAATFTQDERGILGADGKRKNPGVLNYDDTVMTAMITEQASLLAPSPSRIFYPTEQDEDRSVRILLPDGYAR